MTRPDLARVQDELQRFLLAAEPGIETHVRGTARVPVATRLGIYANAYRARLVEALQSNYPVLAQLLGTAEFTALGNTYLRAHDSHSCSVRWYGDALPAFLETHPAYAQAGLLAELARWEWAMTEVFDAADANPVGRDALAGIAPDQWVRLRLAWHPAVRRLALHWNAPATWRAVSDAAERPLPVVVNDAQDWLLWRHDLRIYFRSLTPAEAAVIDLSREGAHFGDLCERLVTDYGNDETPARLAAQLHTWLDAGLLVGVDCSA